MRRCTGVQRVAIRQGPNELRGVGYVPRRKEKSRRGTAMREESGGRANTSMMRGEARGEKRRGRRVREETERVQGECKRESGKERKGEKERRCAGKRGGTRYRKCEKERKREREDTRMKAGGREGERERKRAAARSAEGARRPHMCSETNVRSECRLLPIIRCRGVPLCARGWSADSVPRFYAAR